MSKFDRFFFVTLADWFPCLFVIFLVILSGAISWVEGTFSGKQTPLFGARRITMPFLNHGGMWGDLLIMSVVVRLITPYLLRWEWWSAWQNGQRGLLPESVLQYGWVVTTCLLIFSFLMTLAAHTWWEVVMEEEDITGHIFAQWPTRGLTLAGQLHVAAMTTLLTVVLWYAIYPTYPTTTRWVSLLLTIHVFLGTVQPGWYCSGKLWTWGNFAPPLVATGLIWTVAAAKLH